MKSRPTTLLARAATLAAAAVLACSATWLLAALPAYGQDALTIDTEASAVVVKLGERPLLGYQYVENPAKPYVARLFSPAGVNVLRDSPLDHKHHHSLMFAVAVDGVDFWSENEKCGRQVHREARGPELLTMFGLNWAAGEQKIDWVAPGDASLLLRETRTLAVCRTADTAATFLGWQSRLETPPGKESVTLSGSPYFGLGMRFLPSMDTGGTFQNADGKTGVAGTNDARSAWCAYSAAADGKPVTVAVFDDPKNPRHPATWFTMDQGFAYVSATLNLSKEPLKVEAGKPLVLRYAVAVWDGRVEKDKIEALYRRAIGWSTEKPKP